MLQRRRGIARIAGPPGGPPLRRTGDERVRSRDRGTGADRKERARTAGSGDGGWRGAVVDALREELILADAWPGRLTIGRRISSCRHGGMPPPEVMEHGRNG